MQRLYNCRGASALGSFARLEATGVRGTLREELRSMESGFPDPMKSQIPIHQNKATDANAETYLNSHFPNFAF